jgi:hypothetical protein
MKRLRFAVIGAALAYFFDPQNGARRRSRALERLAGLAGRHTGAGDAQPDLGEELAGQAKDVQSAQVASD